MDVRAYQWWAESELAPWSARSVRSASGVILSLYTRSEKLARAKKFSVDTITSAGAGEGLTNVVSLSDQDAQILTLHRQRQLLKPNQERSLLWRQWRQQRRDQQKLLLNRIKSCNCRLRSLHDSGLPWLWKTTVLAKRASNLLRNAQKGRLFASPLQKMLPLT